MFDFTEVYHQNNFWFCVPRDTLKRIILYTETSITISENVHKFGNCSDMVTHVLTCFFITLTLAKNLYYQVAVKPKLS